MEINEFQLVAACQKGRLENFAPLYDAYVRKIYNYLFYRVRHREMAEDLTSLTFTKALERIRSYDAGKGKFNSWLYQIAKNSLIDHYKNRRPAEGLETAADLAGKQNVAAEAEARISLEKVQKYLQNLDEAKREIITLRVWDGLTHREIAEILGISEANSKMTFSRALAKLQKDLNLSAILILISIINLKF